MVVARDLLGASNINVDPVPALVAIARIEEKDWAAYKDQEWFSYNYKDGAFVVLPAIAPIMRRNTAGVEVAEGGRAELRPKCLAAYADRGMTIKLAKKAWQQYLALRIDCFELLSLATQDAHIGRTASPVLFAVAGGATVADTEVVEVPDDDKGAYVLEGTICLDEAERVGVKRRFCDLQENCCAKRRRVPSTVADAFDLAEELLAGVDTVTSIAQSATEVDRVKKSETRVGKARSEADAVKARVRELILLQDSTK